MQSPNRGILNNRDAANKIRHGSPRFQDVLRERCRKRMHEKRRELFNSRRLSACEDQKLPQEMLTEIMRQEFSSMTADDELLSTIGISKNENNLIELEEELLNLEQRILQMQEHWILEEYLSLQEFEKLMDEFYANCLQEEVFCPICQKSTMIEKSGVIVCTGCQFNLPMKVSLQDFSNILKSKTNDHSTNCHCLPTFITVPENDSLSLYLTCETCSYCSLII